MTIFRSLSERKAMAAILIFAALIRIALAFRSEPLIYTKYFQEDAYYLFNCSEHFAHGEGFSVDGIHPTNGVQPLIVVLYAPLFLLSNFDKVLTLKFAFVYTALFDCLSMVLLFLLLKTLKKKRDDEQVASVWLKPPVIAALLYGTLFSIFVHTVSGLETGLYSMLIIASLYQYALILKSRKETAAIPLWKYLGLGITLGLAVLARIDGVIFVGMIALYELITLKGRAIVSASVISVSSFIVSLPWWYYNYSTFGSLMPQSGISERLDANILRSFWQTISTIADCFSVFFSLTKMIDIPIIYYIIWFIVVLTGVIWIFRKWKLRQYLHRAYSIDPIIPLLWTGGALAFYYTFFFAAPHFIPRYLQPLRIAILIVAAMVIPEIIRELSGSRLKKIILYLFIAAAAANTFVRYPPNFLTKDISSFYLMGKWALTKPESRIGMYQTGATGFIAPNVVNLDGKVNYEALLARQNGGIGKYIAIANLDYIADQPLLASEIVQSAEKYGMHYVLSDSIKEVMIYKRVR